MMVVIDTETTGLLLHPDAEISRQPRIVEFAAALLCTDTGEVIDTISVLINPCMAMPPDATKINGITDVDLKDAPPFVLAVNDIELFVRCADIMIAHNMPFDRGMLENELRLIGRDCAFAWPKRSMCTVGLYKDEYGHNPKLTELYQDVIGKSLAQSHRALDDVMALVEIIQKERLWVL